MAFGQTALDEIARPRENATTDNRVERFVGKHEQPIVRDSLVDCEQKLIETPPIDHLGKCHARAPRGRARERTQASKRVRLVCKVKERRVEQIRPHEGTVDVEETCGHPAGFRLR
jgi:hypothetical protein